MGIINEKFTGIENMCLAQIWDSGEGQFEGDFI